MSRRLTAASSERIITAVGGAAFAFGPGSIFAIFRLITLPGAGSYPFLIRVGSTANQGYGLYYNGDSSNLNSWIDNSDGQGPTLTANKWYFGGYTKVTGSANVRFHLYDYATDTWTHVNQSAFAASPNSSVPTTSITYGSEDTLTWFINGDMLIAGIYNVVATDAQAEAMAFSLPAWWAPAQPKSLVLFDQDAVTQKVVDWSGGGANETSRNGTSISATNPPLFTYGHTIDVSKQPAAAGPIAITTAVETDTALALVTKKTKAITLASETDTATALGTRKKTKAITTATETDTAIALSNKIHKKAITLASETDTALVITPHKVRLVTVTVATETDTAFAISAKKKKKAVTTATETDSAMIIAVLVPVPTEQVLYSVHIGWSGRNSGVFVVGNTSSLIAPLKTSPGYARIKENFSPSYSGTYDDVTSSSLKVICKHGREGTSDRMSAGTIDLTLFDPDQLYNPRNVTSPLFEYITPMLPCRVRMSMDTGATWIDLAHGWMRSGDFDYDLGTKEARFHFEDMFLWLDREKDPGPVIVDTGPIRVDEALHLVLNEILWPETKRVFDRGSNLGNFAADGSKSALQLVEDLMLVDGGTFYQSREMNAVYANTWHRAFETIAHSFEVADVVIPGMDLDNVKNVASSTLEGSEPQVYEDAASIQRYGRSAHQAVTSPWFLDDTAALDTSRRKVTQTKDSKSKVWQFIVSEGPLGYHEQMGTLDLLNKIEVVQPDTPGVYHIEQIVHEIEAAKFHRTKWVLSEALEQDPFFIGTGTIAPAVDSVGYAKIV